MIDEKRKEKMMNKEKPKTTILNPWLHWTMLSLLLTVVCLSPGL